MKDSFQTAHQNVSGLSLLHRDDKVSSQLREVDLSGYARVVVVDTREFKSSLPSYLFHTGFKVVPLFLKTADYVLNDEAAVEKKSVHTRDLHNSLKSGRLEDQLRRLSSSFRRAYLLI